MPGYVTPHPRHPEPAEGHNGHASTSSARHNWLLSGIDVK